MNEAEAKNAITQMISFIESEANDRVMEIKKKTEEECTIGETTLTSGREGEHDLRSPEENEGRVRKEDGRRRGAAEDVREQSYVLANVRRP